MSKDRTHPDRIVAVYEAARQRYLETTHKVETLDREARALNDRIESLRHASYQHYEVMNTAFQSLMRETSTTYFSSHDAKPEEPTP